MNNKYLLRATAILILTLPSGCAYYFSPEYQEVLRADLIAFSNKEVDGESSRLLKIIKEESLKEAKDKY